MREARGVPGNGGAAHALVRLLGGERAAQVADAELDVAERLAGWVGVLDAVALSAALRSPARPPQEQLRRTGDLPLEEHFRQVRAALVKAITATLGTGWLPPSEPVPDAQPGFATYRQRHLELQRTMDLMIHPLRDHVRQVLSRTSAPLRRLAALDAQWEQVLSPREQKLLAALPPLLERRLRALRQKPSDGQRNDFGTEFQQVLLAELNLRLEPVTGLIEAFLSHTDTTPSP